MAILLVIIHHCVYIPPLGNVFAGMPAPQSGRLGVAVFFVLSGFLMGLTVFREGKPFDAKSYAVRRFGKIYPPFLLSIAFATAVYLCSHDSSGVLRQIILYVTSLGSFVPVQASINDVYWSLLVEIQFYLVLPVVHFCFKALVSRPAWWTSASFLIFPLLYRTVYYLHHQAAGEYGGFFSELHKRADAFAPGLLFACFVMRGGTDFVRRHADAFCLGGLILGMATLAFYEATFHTGLSSNEFTRTLTCDVSYLLIQIATLGLMCSIFAGHSVFSRLLSGRAVALIGVVSYEWYLFHIPMLHGARQLVRTFELQPVPGYLLKLGVPTLGAFLLAWAVYRWFSLPVLEWLKRRYTRR